MRGFRGLPGDSTDDVAWVADSTPWSSVGGVFSGGFTAVPTTLQPLVDVTSLEGAVAPVTRSQYNTTVAFDESAFAGESDLFTNFPSGLTYDYQGGDRFFPDIAVTPTVVTDWITGVRTPVIVIDPNDPDTLTPEMSIGPRALACACAACTGQVRFEDEGSGGIGGVITPLHFQPPTDGVAPNGKEIFSWDEAAAQITRTNLAWTFTIGNAAAVTYAFRSTAPVDPEDGIGGPNGTDGFNRFTATQIQAAEYALATWSDVARITFNRVGSGTEGEGAYSDNATMLFSNYTSGATGAAAFAYLPHWAATGASALQGDLFFNSNLAYNVNPVLGDYGPQVFAHEIGHAIGLSHPAAYNASGGASPTYENDAIYWQDSRAYTIMSYFGSGGVGHSLNGFAAGPQLHDIAAAQRLYGANMTTRTGDTTYGFNSNTGRMHLSIEPGQSPVFAIWDAGGTDTLDLSGFNTNSEIDLREESFSSAGPGNGGVGIAIGNISIARGAVIENAIGGGGNDTIIGNAANNVLTGNGGADSMNGADGNDTVSYVGSDAGVTINLTAGTASGGHATGDTLASIENATGSGFNDSLTGTATANTLNGGGGDDTLIGLAGADTLNGGDGNDTINYAASAGGVTVDLAAGTASGADATGDVLSSIESVTGTAFNDVLTGSDASNTLQGLGGNDTLSGGVGADLLQGGDNDDTLIGGLGADTLAGGAGFDTASYAGSSAGVTVNLATGIGTGGDAQGDVYGSIEGLIGSSFNDVLTGRDGIADNIAGGVGDDTINGGTGGDTLSGGDGVDTLDYSNSFNGVDVRLFNGLAAGGSANGDTHTGFENIRGSNTFTDTLAGDDGVNFIWGGGGNETITGRDGNDHLFGEDGNDTVLGGAGEDVLYGSIGNDTFGGGADDDLVDFSASNAGVTVNLQTGSGVGGHAQGDSFVSIEDIIGSQFDDVIIGKTNFWNNVFDGAGGNDTLTGGDGNDTFVFRIGDGSDTVTDFLAGAASGDKIQMTGWGAAFDTFAEVIAAASQVGADTVFNFGNGQTLTLNNVTLGTLNANDFLFA